MRGEKTLSYVVRRVTDCAEDLASATQGHCYLLYRAKIFVNRENCGRALSDRRCNAPARSRTHISYRKYARHVGFKQKWIPLQRPPTCFAVHAGEIGPGQDETRLVEIQQTVNKFGSRCCPDTDEHRCNCECALFRCVKVAEDNLFKPSDDGAGIPEDIMAKIFDPFFTTKPIGEGTGLGLDIVRRIVQLQGGEIDVNSRPSRTEFCVKIPVPVRE